MGYHDLLDLHFECRLIFSVTNEGTAEPGLWKWVDAGRIPPFLHPFFGNLGLTCIVVTLTNESRGASLPVIPLSLCDNDN